MNERTKPIGADDRETLREPMKRRRALGLLGIGIAAAYAAPKIFQISAAYADKRDSNGCLVPSCHESVGGNGCSAGVKIPSCNVEYAKKPDANGNY